MFSPLWSGDPSPQKRVHRSRAPAHSASQTNRNNRACCPSRACVLRTAAFFECVISSDYLCGALGVSMKLVSTPFYG